MISPGNLERGEEGLTVKAYWRMSASVTAAWRSAMIGAAIADEVKSAAAATEYRVCFMTEDWECKMDENGEKNV